MQKKNFDHITVQALTIIAEEGLVHKFLKESGLYLCPGCAVPVSEVRKRFDQYSQKTLGLLYTREFFEMILLTSLPELSVSDIDFDGEDVDCFYGIALSGAQEIEGGHPDKFHPKLDELIDMVFNSGDDATDQDQNTDPDLEIAA